MSVEAIDDELATPEPASGGRYAGLEDLIDALQHRLVLFLGFVGAVLAILLPPTGLGMTTCTFLSGVGLPCPSCGLTRSVTCVYHGMFHAAWEYNPFGFGFAFLFGLYAVLFVMPKGMIEKVRARARRQAFGITVVLVAFILGLVVHGITRAVLVGTDSPYYSWWRHDRVPPVLQENRPAEISAGPDADCCTDNECTKDAGGANG